MSDQENENRGKWIRQGGPDSPAFRRRMVRGWTKIPAPFSGLGPRSYFRANEEIYKDVCARMTSHGQLDASNIEVRVEQGEVTLTGEVPDRRAKRLAEDISASVPGVQDVHNRLKIQQGMRKSNW